MLRECKKCGLIYKNIATHQKYCDDCKAKTKRTNFNYNSRHLNLLKSLSREINT